MKKISLSLLTLLFVLPTAANANDPTAAAMTQQQCTTDADCKLISNLSQPISGSCVNARCQINVAQNAAPDYTSGAYGVPEAPVADKVPPAAYQGVDDKKGNFSAYNLPQEDVKAGTVGTIYDRVYVPPSAPVSGGNYVPVGQTAAPTAPVAATAAPVPAPAYAPPPAAAPMQPAYPAPAPAQAPQPAQQVIPMSDVPAMRPSLPNQQVPTPPPAPAPAIVEAPQAPTTYIAPDPLPTGPVVPSVGAPGVPVAPPGSKPIPPSDLKPAPSLLPPPGGKTPVNPEDPGAPPPEGSTIMMKDGNLGISTTDASKADKDFSAAPKSEARAKKLGTFN